MNKYYLAYGSNLNLNSMNNRCQNAQVVGTTILKDYRLVYKGSCDNYAYLTIEPSEGNFVPVAIYEINKKDEINLDYYEDYPKLYYKKNMNINIKGKDKQALIYIMNDEFEYHVPNLNYVLQCRQGYRDFNFDIQILGDAYTYTEEKIENNKKEKKM